MKEKLALVRKSQEWSRKARIPGAKQTVGVDLIREDRDHGIDASVAFKLVVRSLAARGRSIG